MYIQEIVEWAERRHSANANLMGDPFEDFKF